MFLHLSPVQIRDAASLCMIMQGGMPGSTLPELVLVVSLVRGAAGSWPVVTWHGAGGTMAECDQMIATIR